MKDAVHFLISTSQFMIQIAFWFWGSMRHGDRKIEREKKQKNRQRQRDRARQRGWDGRKGWGKERQR